MNLICKALMVIALITLPVFANDKDEPIENSSELRHWCQSESKKYYQERGITPYNWSATGWIKDNILKVKGSWRINNESITVFCQVKKGNKKVSATFDLMKK